MDANKRDSYITRRTFISTSMLCAMMLAGCSGRMSEDKFKEAVEGYWDSSQKIEVSHSELLGELYYEIKGNTLYSHHIRSSVLFDSSDPNRIKTEEQQIVWDAANLSFRVYLSEDDSNYLSGVTGKKEVGAQFTYDPDTDTLTGKSTIEEDDGSQTTEGGGQFV